MELEKVQTIDPDNYIGEICQIVTAEYVELSYGEAVKIVGENLELKGEDSLPEGKTLNASAVFGLFKNKEGKVIVGIDSKLHKFLESKKIDIKKMPEYKEGAEISALLGVKCKVQKNKNNFLDLV